MYLPFKTILKRLACKDNNAPLKTGTHVSKESTQAWGRGISMAVDLRRGPYRNMSLAAVASLGAIHNKSAPCSCDRVFCQKRRSIIGNKFKMQHLSTLAFLKCLRIRSFSDDVGTHRGRGWVFLWLAAPLSRSCSRHNESVKPIPSFILTEHVWLILCT